MKNKKGTSLLKIDNFLVETDKINSSDETFNKLMFLYSAALKQLETKMDILKWLFHVKISPYEKYDYLCK